MTTDVKTLTEDRASQHGDFAERSAIAQGIKSVIHNSPLWQGHSLKPYQRQALDEIAGKISRVLAGDPDVIDHWDDIAGYAGLVSKYLHAEAPLFGQPKPDKRKQFYAFKAGSAGFMCPTCRRRSAPEDTIYAKDSISDPVYCKHCVDEHTK